MTVRLQLRKECERLLSFFARADRTQRLWRSAPEPPRTPASYRRPAACPAWDRQRVLLPEDLWRTAWMAHAGGVAAGSRGRASRRPPGAGRPRGRRTRIANLTAGYHAPAVGQARVARRASSSGSARTGNVPIQCAIGSRLAITLALQADDTRGQLPRCSATGRGSPASRRVERGRADA
jgi:hypothetical protein